MEGKLRSSEKDVLVAKQNELKKEGKANKPNAACMLTDEEVDHDSARPKFTRLLFVRGPY